MDRQGIILTFGPMTIFFVVIFFALINTGIYLIASKYRLPEYYDMHRRRWMPVRCEFCVFFWMGMVELSLWYCYYKVGPIDFTACMMLPAIALCGSVISLRLLK